MDTQASYFAKTRQDIILRLGATAGQILLGEALYLLAIGTNGFESVDSACCRVIGRRGGLVPCGSLSRLCPDRTKFVSWDPFHPTESANLIGAKHALDGGLQYVSPMNIRQLANA
ncbi:hypothetical protein POUND7_003110 [Theobroma cacao]